MIRRLAILHRRPDVDADEFVRYWLETHSQVVLKVPGLHKFGTNLVIESRVPGLQPDAIGELWGERFSGAGTGYDGPERRAVRASGHTIIDQGKNTNMILDRQQEFVPEGATVDIPPTVRSFAILHRRSDVSPEEFTRYWHEEHAPRVLLVPGVLKFATNLVLECGVEGITPDAVGEVWWVSEEARQAREQAPQYAALLASGAKIIDQSRNTGMTVRELRVFDPAEARGGPR